MSSIEKTVACAFLLAAAAFHPARAQSLADQPCLSPLAPNAPDPQPRNVHLSIADGHSVTAQACIVSNMRRMAGLNVSFSVFDKDGTFLGTGGQDVGAQTPTDGTKPANPRIVVNAAAGMTIDPKPAGQLLDIVLVRISWLPCKATAPKACENQAWQSATFLRKAAIAK